MDRQPLYDVFISYAAANEAWVEGYLLDALTAAGVRVHSEAAFALGAPLLGEFEHAVRNSERTLLILSPAYLADSFSQFGDLLAQAYGLESATWPVIPLILEPVELPPRLAILTPLDMTDRSEWPEGIERLGQTLQHTVPRDGPIGRPPCPYPGMVPFGEDDDTRFFGRDEDIDALVNALHIAPFVTIIGPSGSGKSSLVFAGLIPALKESSLFGDEPWQVYSVRPGKQPLHALQDALGRKGAARKGSVATFFTRRSPEAQSLLVIDQFEELFTLADPAEADKFQTALLELDGIPNLYIVLTVRADFYGDLMASALWHQISAHRIDILPLDEVGLREAILRPAETTEVYVEAALVERLAADASGEPGMLPLMQETLVLLWEHLERRYLSLRAYETLVLPRRSYRGHGSELNGLQVAIARRADAAHASLSPVQQAIARRVFVRLVHFGEGRADTRRQQHTDLLRDPSDDTQVFDDTLHVLTSERLLTLTGDEQGGRRVDLAHEALISGWPTLQGWITGLRESEIVRRRLEGKAAEWKRLGKGPGGLLDEAELIEADRWLEEPMTAEVGVGQDVHDLIRSSRESIDARRQEEEDARQRELDLAHELAETQRQRAEEQAGVAGRLRGRLIIAAIAAVLAVVAATIALVAFRQAQEESVRADQQATIARVRALAGQAPAQLQLHNDELASLLALQAWNFHVDTNGEAWHQVDMALRQTMSAPYFSRVVASGAATDALAYQPGGTLLATGDRTGQVRLWDVAAPGTPPEVIQESGDWITALAFSTDGGILAVGQRDGTVTLYQIDSGDASSTTLGTTDGQVSSLAFTGDVLAAIVERPPSASNWNLSTGESEQVPTPDGAATLQAIILDSSGRTLLTGMDHDGALRLWGDEASGQEGRLLPGQSGWTSSTSALSDSGRWLVGAGTDGSLRVWDLQDPATPPRSIPASSRTDAIRAVAVDPEGARIAALMNDGTVVVWAPDATSLPDILLGHENVGLAMRFSPDGSHLATGAGDGVRIWDLDPPAEPAVLNGHSGLVYAVAYSADGMWLASGGRDGTVLLWNPEDLERAPIELPGGGGWITALAFSPDNRLLAASTSNGDVLLWHMDEPDREPESLSGEETITSIAFSPDGERLAVTAEVDVVIRDLATSSVRATLLFPGERVQSIAFSPDGETLAAGGCLEAGDQEGVCDRGGIALWALDSADDPPETRDHPNDSIMAIAFEPGGRWIAAAGKDGVVDLWDVEDPSADAVHFEGPGAASVAFGPASDEIAVGHWNGTISVWRIDRPGTPSLISAHRGYVYALAYAPDGQTLAATGSDGTVQLWNSTETLASEVCDRVGRNLTPQEWERFIGTSTPYEPTCPGLPLGSAGSS